MSGFTYRIENPLPRDDFEQMEIERYAGLPLLGEVVKEAQGAISQIEQFGQLPERNQKLILDMAGFAFAKANDAEGSDWRENFWGLYIVGSRARGEAREDSDLDLLSAGTLYRSQGFMDIFGENSVFDGLELDVPKELPSEYNVGAVDRKYLVRARAADKGVLPVDLNVADLTFVRTDLKQFKTREDVSEDGSELARVPLFEVTVAQEYWG